MVAGFQGMSPSVVASPHWAAAAPTRAVAMARALAPMVRHLYRRRRCLHHRSAHRAKARGSTEGLLRGDAGDGLARRQGAADALGRARHGNHARSRVVKFRRPRRYRPSTDRPGHGTLVCDEEEIVEKPGRQRIAYSRTRQGHLLGVNDQPGGRRRDLRPPRRRQRQRRHDRAERHARRQATDMAFTVRRAELPRALEVLEGAKEDIGSSSVQSSTPTSPRFRSSASACAAMPASPTRCSGPCRKGINIQAIATSEIKISVLIDAAYAELAVRTLHSIDGLDAD